MIKYDYAVYWPPAGRDARNQQLYGPPVELPVRWDERARLFINAQGEQKVSRALVYVGQDLEVNGVLWHGRLANANQAAPYHNPGAAEIQQWQKTPSLRYKWYVRLATL
jgi:hypothetical protein